MKMKFFSLLVVMFLSFSSFAGVKIFDSKKNAEISTLTFLNSLPLEGQLVLGEYHYQESIQKAEGDIIRQVVRHHNLENSFSVCWEFLDYPKQEEVAREFNSYSNGEITMAQMLNLLFPGSRQDQNRPYRHFFMAADELGGEVIATNAPRKWKKIITSQGIGYLDPALVPDHYEIGSDHYLARFKVAMGGHAPDDMVAKYFEAQSYTDSVMANSMKTIANENLKFLIVGSFHSDYNDGVVRELNKIMTLPTTTIKIVDISEMTSEEVEALKTPHRTYGALADFLYLVDGK